MDLTCCTCLACSATVCAGAAHMCCYCASQACLTSQVLSACVDSLSCGTACAWPAASSWRALQQHARGRTHCCYRASHACLTSQVRAHVSIHKRERTDLWCSACSGLLHPPGVRCNKMCGAAHIGAAVRVSHRLAGMLRALPARLVGHPAKRAQPASSMCLWLVWLQTALCNSS